MRLALHVSTPETCVYTFVFGISLSVFLTLSPLHVSTPETCVAQSSVFIQLCLESLSLFFSLYLSLSLPGWSPSSSCCLFCISIFSSRSICLSVVWECVFDSEKKRASVKVQGNSWYQGVESLSLTHSLTDSLSHFLSISPSSLSEIRVVHWKLCRQSICNLVSMRMSSDFETPR